MTNLFRFGHFVLHSGEASDFKIDCDALTEPDWNTLANLIRQRVPAIGAVIGIPKGGLPLQQALEPFACGAETAALLIVDDVYTTGQSMRETYDLYHGSWKGPILGVVAFARGAIQEPWVQALWQLSLDRDSATNLFAAHIIQTHEIQRLRARIRELQEREL